MVRKNLCKTFLLTAVFTAAVSMTSYASMDLESSAAVSGISVALNNYFARTMEPEKALAESVKAAGSEISIRDDAGLVKAQAVNKLVSEVNETEAAIPESAYQNIAISKIDVPVHIRTEPTTQSDSVGMIANHAAATILDTVEGENGTWYKIQSGSVTGYIKATYFVTGEEAEKLAKEVVKVYGRVTGTPNGLKLRSEPSLEASTLTMLMEGETYRVLGEDGNFLKIQVDEDLVGYVFKDYIDTNITYNEAVSTQEEAKRKEEEAQRKKEAEEALKKLEEEKKKQEKVAETTKAQETVAETIKETTKASTEAETVPALDDDDFEDEETEEEITEEETEETTKKETAASPGYGPGVGSATRTAMVAFAKQYLGYPYVYGGTSLTEGCDCSGFTMRIYENFGMNIGRTSRDQAAKGKEIDAGSAQPGDLFFYDSGGYINHVSMYIGGGQVIHASSTTTGIIISSAYYRTPCKVCTYMK